jgi:hypothetical protein
MVAASSGIPCRGREHAGLDFDIAFLGLDVKMNRAKLLKQSGCILHVHISRAFGNPILGRP